MEIESHIKQRPKIKIYKEIARRQRFEQPK